tara:strand:+ start:3767 stop:4462 length:696 start_codon:yes stop_codon:yes gene_type:complete
MKLNKINNLVILAAGRGIRMKPLTNKIPKAMAPLNQSTLIAEGLKRFKNKIKNVHITVGYKGSMLAKHVIEYDVSSVINTEGKGNAWWLYNSILKKLDEPTYVITCDNIFNINLKKYENEYYKLKSPACMIIPTRPVENLGGDYVFFDNKNFVTNISRRKISQYYCSGIQIINPEKINAHTKKTENFYKVWSQLISIKKIKCSSTLVNNWFAVDNVMQLKIANREKKKINL